MNLIRSIRSMPVPLIGLLAVFALVPFLSLLGVEAPWGAYSKGATGRAIWLTITYWVFPLGICYSLLSKHYLFLPMYLVQCILLTLHTVMANVNQPMEIQMARLLLIALMIYVGFLLGNRNFLYPLMTREFRFWRRSVRFRVGRGVYVETEGEQTPALLQDVSTTGLQVSVHPKEISPRLKDAERGANILVVVPSEDGDPEFRLALEVMWASESTRGDRRFGCRAMDKVAMKSYVEQEKRKSRLSIDMPKSGKFPLEEDIQETALVLWLVCIALSFALPALGWWG